MTNTQVDAVLKLTLTDGGVSTDAECQVINSEFTQPSSGEPENVSTACGNGPVAQPGDPVNGSLTGEVFKDTSAAGITRLLAKAVEANTQFQYVYTENPGTSGEFSFTGLATVPSFAITFTPSKFGRHSFALTIVSATLADPAPAP